jgi:hypothetical protein
LRLLVGVVGWGLYFIAGANITNPDTHAPGNEIQTPTNYPNQQPQPTTTNYEIANNQPPTYNKPTPS